MEVKTEAKTCVQFAKRITVGQAHYNAGDIAVFGAEKAAQLVKIGAAEEHKDQKAHVAAAEAKAKAADEVKAGPSSEAPSFVKAASKT